MDGPCSAEDHRGVRGTVCPRCGLRPKPDPLESLDNFACIEKQEEVNGNMQLDKAEGDYLKASFVKKRSLTTVRIVDEGTMQEYEQKGELVQKPVFGISYVGQGPNDPYKWTMNNKTRNALLDIFGYETSLWVGQSVEITLAGEGEYQHVTVDPVRTKYVAPQAQAPPQAPPQAPAPQPQAPAPQPQAPAPQPQAPAPQPQAQPPAPAAAPATAPV